VDKATRRRSPFAYLLVLTLIIVSAAGALWVKRSGIDPPSLLLSAAFKLLTGDGSPETQERVAQPAQASPPTEQPAEPPVEEHVNAVTPSLRATIPEGVSGEILSKTRTVPGVGAAAAVLLSNLTVELPGGGGDAQVSVAAIDPLEFRPLAPEASAQAKFVWEGLNKSETFIAHEQFQILGGKPLKTLAAKGPNGRKEIRIAGLAANGVPNLAGAMMSMQQANSLGLGNPTLLMVGLNKDAQYSQVITELGKTLPGIKFEETRPLENRTFFSGSAAQKAIGSFKYTGNADGSIRQDSGWVARNIVGKNVPILGRVRCHKAMFTQLEAALTEIQDSGLASSIKPGQFGGCYVPRFIERDGTRPISMHAWGLAIDINTAENPKGGRPNMDPRIVAIFEKWGFRWGGRWSPPDGHHFELAALLKQK
jgi:D-alanyl-D-alanine carboxypeptidase-like protein